MSSTAWRAQLKTGGGAAAVLGMALLLGYLTAWSPGIGLGALLAIVALLGLLVTPAAAWVVAAAVAAVLFRGLSSIGVLPGFAPYLDLGLSWGALTAAVLQGAISAGISLSRANRRIVLGTGLLAATVLVSGLLNSTEPVRPFFYLALIGEPFAIIGALLLQPPVGRMRTAVTVAVAALIAVQAPLMLGQFLTGGGGDNVAGTLYGSRAGAHLAGGLCVVGLFWWLARSRYPLSLRELPITILLAAGPFLSNAKQVIYALPAALLVPARGARWGTRVLLFIAIAVSVVVVVLAPGQNGGYANNSIDATLNGNATKIDTAKTLFEEMADPISLFVGQGPAKTVSHAAFLTTDPVTRGNSPVEVLHMKPSQRALNQPQEQAAGSFDSPQSSALGLIGDIGLIGALIYGYLFAHVLLACRASGSPEGLAAAAGFAVLLVLALVNDWLEQPGFTLPLAVLAGLALTASADPPGPGPPAGEREPDAVPRVADGPRADDQRRVQSSVRTDVRGRGTDPDLGVP